jgi:hypothetical protein
MIKRKWFLAPLLVGALAVALVGGGSVFTQVFAQTSDGAAWQHGEQHERPLDGGGTYAHGQDHARPLDEATHTDAHP